MGGYWLAFFHYSVYAGILYILLRLAGFACRTAPPGNTHIPQAAKGAFVVVMAILVYGAWNAVHPVVREVEHDTGKNLPQPVKIDW